MGFNRFQLVISFYGGSGANPKKHLLVEIACILCLEPICKIYLQHFTHILREIPASIQQKRAS